MEVRGVFSSWDTLAEKSLLLFGPDMGAGVHNEDHGPRHAFRRAHIDPQIKPAHFQHSLAGLLVMDSLVDRSHEFRIPAQAHDAVADIVGGDMGLEQMDGPFVAGKDILVSIDKDQTFPHTGDDHGHRALLHKS